MNGAVMLEQVELYSTHDFQAEGYYCSFEIIVCNTSVSSLSTSFEDNYCGNTPVLVLSADTLSIDWKSTTPGWNGFTFDNPFPYNGIGNLVIEFKYMGSSGTTVNTRAMSLPSADRCLDAGYPNSTYGSLMSFLTGMRIHYTITGISDESPQPAPPDLSVTVNPSNGLVPVQIEMPTAGNTDLTVYSIAGNLIKGVHSGFLTQGTHFFNADLTGFPSGIYLLICSSENAFSTASIALIR